MAHASKRATSSVAREDRRHDPSLAPRTGDTRNAFEHDRDRVLHTAAFRRLAGITQTVAGDTGNHVHNRLTHVLEVAQVGRRLAERLLRDSSQKAESLGGISPDVVETVCLAHDLGHPPFGHIAEDELKLLARAKGFKDGFEGNAQSFRVVTRLAMHNSYHPGLDLTRATLNALLKYPWLAGDWDKDHGDKCGAYSTDKADFEFARSLSKRGRAKSVEAELMDFADDIAYAVHDMQDFYCAGRIPLDRLINAAEESDRFLDGAIQRLKIPPNRVKRFRGSWQRVKSLIYLAVKEPFRGSREQRAGLRTVASELISHFIVGLSLRDRAGNDGRVVQIEQEIADEIDILKQLTWHYVILDASLATQQHGQRTIIRYLFNTYLDATAGKKPRELLPASYREMLEEIGGKSAPRKDRVQLVLDLIAGMTEQQAVEMYHRLSGVSLGGSLDTIIL